MLDNSERSSSSLPTPYCLSSNSITIFFPFLHITSCYASTSPHFYIRITSSLQLHIPLLSNFLPLPSSLPFFFSLLYQYTLPPSTSIFLSPYLHIPFSFTSTLSSATSLHDHPPPLTSKDPLPSCPFPSTNLPIHYPSQPSPTTSLPCTSILHHYYALNYVTRKGSPSRLTLTSGRVGSQSVYCGANCCHCTQWCSWDIRILKLTLVVSIFTSLRDKEAKLHWFPLK